jgi:hypothetical protein
VPSHDITREIYAISQRSSLFHNKPVRFIRCFLNIKLMVFLLSSAYPRSCVPLCACALVWCLSGLSAEPHTLFPSRVSSPCLYFLYIFSQDGSPPIMFLLSEGNLGQPGLPDPVVLQADILQSDHASIHGGG